VAGGYMMGTTKRQTPPTYERELAMFEYVFYSTVFAVYSVTVIAAICSIHWLIFGNKESK